MSDVNTIGPERHFREQLDKGTFLIQRCSACSRAVFQPRVICPHCGDPELAWEAPTGKGTVYSKTIVRRKAEQGGDYNVVLVDLEEGVRMMSRIEDARPEDITIGMEVAADVVQGEEGMMVVFRPREARQ